jgi:hypothetical protein
MKRRSAPFVAKAAALAAALGGRIVYAAGPFAALEEKAGK